MKIGENNPKIIRFSLGKYKNYVLLVVLVLLGLTLYRNIGRIRKSNEKIEETRQRVEELKGKNEELRQQLEVVESDLFVEKQLRDKLGLAKEGEIVVVLPDDETLRKLAPKYEEEEAAIPDPNWKKWLNLFY